MKFHWKPVAGVHSLVWDEAVKLQGQDPDFHRRDMFDSIEKGNFFEWEFGVQLLAEADEMKFDFDILDSTKIWPEDLIPVQRVGRPAGAQSQSRQLFLRDGAGRLHDLQRSSGIDFSNDPLPQGRNFSYNDTQLSRLVQRELPRNSH